MYRPCLEGVVDERALEPRFFLKHYQLLRNLRLVVGDPTRTLVLLLPRANAALQPALDRVLPKLSRELANRVRVVHVEDVMFRLGKNQEIHPRLQWQVSALAEKYILGSLKAPRRFAHGR
jgi:hypothetical protein